MALEMVKHNAESLSHREMKLCSGHNSGRPNKFLWIKCIFKSFFDLCFFARGAHLTMLLCGITLLLVWFLCFCPCNFAVIATPLGWLQSYMSQMSETVSHCQVQKLSVCVPWIYLMLLRLYYFKRQSSLLFFHCLSFLVLSCWLGDFLLLSLGNLIPISSFSQSLFLWWSSLLKSHFRKNSFE